MKIYVSNYIPQKCLCLCYESDAPGLLQRRPGFTSSSKRSFVFVPQLIIPSLPSESQILLLQPHLRQCILKVYDKVLEVKMERRERERCKDNPSKTSYPERRVKKPIIHKWGTVRIQYRLKFMVTWNGNKVPSLHCCDPSGVCLNVLTGDILNGLPPLIRT